MPISNDEQKKEKQYSNLKPFKKLEELSPEERQEQKAIQVKGGKARVEQIVRNKTLKEQALVLLNTSVTREEAKKMIGDLAKYISDDDLTIQSVMNLKLFDALTQDGNCKAYELLRDTSGQKPHEKTELEISGEIMTAADRALLDKINARMNAGNDPDV